MRRLPGYGLLGIVALLVASCVLIGNDSLVTVRQVLADPAAFQGKQVRLRGHGVVLAASILCPDHVGLDTRRQFWDEAGSLMAATVPVSLPGDDRKEGSPLPVYTARVLIFEGNQGCGAQATWQRIPYLEVTGVALP